MLINTIKTTPKIHTNNKCTTTHCKHYPVTNKMKETDFDSATPSLMQEMNLARRACWCNIKTDFYSKTFSNVEVNNNNNNNGALDNCQNNDILVVVTDSSKLTTTVIDGAIKSKQIIDPNRSNLNNNTTKPNSTIPNCKPDSDYLNMSRSAKVNTPRGEAGNAAECAPLFEFSQFVDIAVISCKLRQFFQYLYTLVAITTLMRVVKLRMVLLNTLKNITDQGKHMKDAKIMLKCQKEEQRRKGVSCLRTLNKRRFMFVLMSCILVCCVNSIDARPNLSNTLTSGEGASVSAGRTELASSSSPLGSPSAPLVAMSMQKSEGESVEAHEPKLERYPITQVEFERVKTPFIIGVWILFASIAKIGFHMTPNLNKIFPESCLLIVVGVLIGVALFFVTTVNVSPLTPNTFFLYMLPPIILDAGYFMPNRLFFDNLGTILLMAVIGTLFNIATIGGSLWACGLTGIYGESDTPSFLDTFLFSSLISAVDPVAVLAVFEEIHVNEILYIVVFGESLLNDAVTVVMYHMMEAYNEIGIDFIKYEDLLGGVASFFIVALGGTFIGVIWGILTGLVTRFTDHVRVIEPIFIFVMAYLAYLNAEIFHMSGILAITFCGITMKNYVESNISQKSHTTVKYALKMLSSSTETIIFMFLGVATVNNKHVWNTMFVVLTIVFCSVYRVFGVIILTAIANRFRLHKLSNVDQFVMSYGGLRGAVAFALVLLINEDHVKQKAMFVTTTIAVIYFTVFVQGITIKPLVKFLNVKRASKRKPTMNERIHERFIDHLMAGIEDIVGKTGNYNVRDKFKRFDNRFIRPFLIRDLKGAEPKIIETYSKLTMRDAMEVMRRNPSTIGQISGTESMSALFRNYTSNCIGGSPSLTNLENTCSRNLDMHELDYNPSKKDLTDARIHHLLAEELKPYRRASLAMHRRLSYSRHAVDDRDLSTQVNYKLQMNFRRMFKDRQHHKRSKRGQNKQQEGVKQNHVSFHDFQQNGTTKQLSHDYINEVLNESAEEYPPKLTEVTIGAANDDWDDGLTFTAKSSLAENVILEEERNTTRDSDCERRVATPTATESQLPWKREEDEISDAIQQNEFPAWASNKEYLAYNSPSATFLGGLSKPKQAKSVIGLFRRESSGSGSGIMPKTGAIVVDLSEVAVGSDPSLAAALTTGLVPLNNSQQQQQQNIALIGGGARTDKRSASISGTSLAEGGHSGPFPVTASHRRNIRRGSMLELSGDTIPEETHHHSKSLCEPAGDDWTTALAGTAKHITGNSNSEKLLTSSSATSSGREPLLPKLTPRAQIRRMGSKNQVTTALLSTSTSDYDDDEDDDEEEDFDLYDDENIVVTNYATGATNKRIGSGNTGSGSGNITTSSTVQRNNDESII